jgi:hypothetical protein
MLWRREDAVGYWLYLVGFIFVVIGFLVGSFRGSTVRARDISGIVVGRDASGPISQNRQLDPVPARASSKPDRIAWLIAIVGVLIAAAQLVHDLLARE